LKKLYALEMEEYKRKQNEYALDKKNNEPPQEPPIKTLLIPANSSATSVYQVLNDNGVWSGTMCLPTTKIRSTITLSIWATNSSSCTRFCKAHSLFVSLCLLCSKPSSIPF